VLEGTPPRGAPAAPAERPAGLERCAALRRRRPGPLREPSPDACARAEEGRLSHRVLEGTPATRGAGR